MFEQKFAVVVVACFAVLIYFVIANYLEVNKMAEDFTALNAAINKLQADVNTLIASKAQSNQAAIDAATAAVAAVDTTVTAATPPPA